MVMHGKESINMNWSIIVMDIDTCSVMAASKISHGKIAMGRSAS
jgi:hypothetical protein